MPAMSRPVPEATQSAIIELRQYALHPSQREVLIDLFEREFIGAQEQSGIEVIGQFRERNNPDLFVWLRGFPDMEARRKALESFYSGATWMAHRDTANATMIDSDNVLLLRPARPGSGFSAKSRPRAAERAAAGLVVATIYSFGASPRPDFLGFVDSQVLPMARAVGAEPLAELVTEPSSNTFPKLPVREGEQVFVWFARFPSLVAYERYRADLAKSERGRSASHQIHGWINRPAQTLELIPTARSALA